MSAFDTAVADSKKLTSKPSSDDLLEIYSTCFFLRSTLFQFRMFGIEMKPAEYVFAIWDFSLRLVDDRWLKKKEKHR